jgi:hypothetical protein
VDENTDENSLLRLMDGISDISCKGARIDVSIAKSSFDTEQKITSLQPSIGDVDFPPPSQAVSTDGD